MKSIQRQGGGKRSLKLALTALGFMGLIAVLGVALQQGAYRSLPPELSDPDAADPYR